MRGLTPRERALQAFAQLGVWDTEANNGVLIYVLWADHDVEIVADRGFNGRVSAAGMGARCVTAWSSCSRRDSRARPSSKASAPSGALIARHFPGGGSQRTARPAGDPVRSVHAPIPACPRRYRSTRQSGHNCRR